MAETTTTGTTTGTRPDRPADPTQPIEPDASLGELVGRLSDDVGELLSTQLELAKAELKHDLAEARAAATMFAVAGAAAGLAVLLLAFAAAWGLAEVIDAGWAFLVVGVLVGALAAALLQHGRTRMRSATPLAEQTIGSVKEDVTWARQQRS